MFTVNASLKFECWYQCMLSNLSILQGEDLRSFLYELMQSDVGNGVGLLMLFYKGMVTVDILQ